MRFRLLPPAQEEVDGIWLYVARESGSVEFANRQTERFTDCFWLLARNPRAGRARDHDLRADVRSFPVGEFVILYRIEGFEVLILDVVHGSRDLKKLLIN